MTTGRVYQSVIQRERNLEYGGKCVEVVPHIPEEVIRRIKNAARKAKADITIVEIGGTVGIRGGSRKEAKPQRRRNAI